MTDPVKKACDRTYHATRSSGTRPASDIRYIVLHSTESDPGTARSIAQYFASVGAAGSAHLVVDDDHCYGCLADTEIPWGAPPLNTSGFHIEQCGRAAWNATEWLKHEKTIERAAYKAALRCKAHNIPLKLLSATALKNGAEAGVTTHAAISAAFHKSDHSDPGAGYPVTRFMRWLRHYS